MKNIDKIKDDILGVFHEFRFGVTKNDYKPHRCSDFIDCADCLFNGEDCADGNFRKNWLNENYKEPVTLSDDEYNILILMKDYNYITRDNWGCVYFYSTKPTKDLWWWYSDDQRLLHIKLYDNIFRFVKWQDEEPYNIKELIAEYHKNNDKK